METNVQRNRHTNYLSFIALSQSTMNSQSEERETEGAEGAGKEERDRLDHTSSPGYISIGGRPVYLNEMAYIQFIPQPVRAVHGLLLSSSWLPGIYRPSQFAVRNKCALWLHTSAGLFLPAVVVKHQTTKLGKTTSVCMSRVAPVP